MPASKDGSTSASSAITESFFSRFIATPLLFVSFLISLFLIDRQTYSKVFSGHPEHDSYYHTHQRKMAKHEIDDAFHMRNQVLAAMLIISGIGLAVVGWSGSRAYNALFPQQAVV